MKSYILYHGNCFDGFGAAMVAYLTLKNTDCTHIPVLYGQAPPTLAPMSDVYILDFSYPAKVLIELAASQNKVVVLDHHATAEKDLSWPAFKEALNLIDEVTFEADPTTEMNRVRNISLKFDMTKSGAMLAWDYFNPGKPAPMFIQYLQDRDLWLFKLPHSHAINAYIKCRPMEMNLWHWLMDRMESTREREEMITGGIAALNLQRQMVDIMADHVRWIIFDLNDDPAMISLPQSTPICYERQYFVPVANATVFFSEVGEELLNRHPAAPFAAYYMDRGDGKRQWGLRSRPSFDCSVIAKAFGGGGHKQASGFVQDLPANMFLVRG